MKHFRKLPYPHDYKSLRLFVRWFREYQAIRFKLINELKFQNEIDDIFGGDTMREPYYSLLQSIVDMKTVFLTWKIWTK